MSESARESKHLDARVALVKLADANRDPWDTKGGENGQVTNSVGNLLAAQFLKDLPDYASRKFKDGSTAREQYDGWRAALSRATGDDVAFYAGKLAAARFYAKTVLPGLALARKLVEQSDLDLMDVGDDSW